MADFWVRSIVYKLLWIHS
ncbi:hypothetical protein F383_21714 [Gossypium arboreum]|uniref:Uncharacterized protein n=1 Tax=Gossypium arboreum TaxID=29729 RepID=A0A0B0NW36_GOSAR|nr:hypothetical protein F383_21714 [Gossypium arboreum]